MLFKLIAIQVLTILLLCCATVSIKFSDCAVEKNADSVIEWEDLKISPKPIKLSQEFYFGAKVKINQNITENSVSKLQIWRRFKFLQIPFLGTPELKIPCFGGFGSCEDSFCPLLNHQFLCSFLTKSDHICECQLKAATYEAYDIPFSIPNGSQFISFLAQGSYLLKWQILSPDGDVLGCLTMETDVIS